MAVSLQFGTFEGIKRYISSKRNSTKLSYQELYLAGAASGVTNSIVAGPVEHIRIRLQLQNQGKSIGPLKCLREIYKSAGLAGIYKGQIITILREFQGYGAYFVTYDALVRKALRTEEKLSNCKIVLFGAAAGTAFWSTAYPLDVIKSKLQSDTLNRANAKYQGILDCFMKIIRTEGLLGLFRGFTPCILRATPANAATFVAFESTMNFLGQRD